MPLLSVEHIGMSNCLLKEVDVKDSFNMEDIIINVHIILPILGNITITQWPDGVGQKKESVYGASLR